MPPNDPASRINQVVPRWDPQNLDRGFKYDPKNYDREDYARFKEARAARDAARVEKSKEDFMQAMDNVGRVVADKQREEIGANLKPGDVLSIDKPSTCFVSVEWTPDEDQPEDSDEVMGVITGEFHRGGAKVYSAPCTLSDFLAMEKAKSLGGYYNNVEALF